MDEREDQDQTYARINATWDASGLAGRKVLSTPGAAEAIEAVRLHCVSLGWPETLPPMGPVDRDTWSHWLHILSHSVEERGHGPAHAHLEQGLQAVALAALRSHR